MADTIRGSVFVRARALATCEHPGPSQRAIRTDYPPDRVYDDEVLCTACGSRLLAVGPERCWVRPELVEQLAEAVHS